MKESREEILRKLRACENTLNAMEPLDPNYPDYPEYVRTRGKIWENIRELLNKL